MVHLPNPQPPLTFEIAGISLRVSAEDPQLKLGICGTMDRFRSMGSADVELKVRWGVPPLAVGAVETFDSGALWKLFATDRQYIFQFCTPFYGDAPYKAMHLSSQFSAGDIYLRREVFSQSAADALEYPLDELLIIHLLSQGRGVELHACGVVDEEKNGLLFVGHSGAGKSTLGRLWNEAGAGTILSDDRIIVREIDRQWWMYGTPWHGEGRYALNQRAPIRRIYFLTHGLEHELRPLSAAQSVAMLIARSFLPLHSAPGVQFSLQLYQKLVRSIPCHELGFRPDTSVIPFLAERSVNSPMTPSFGS